MKNPISVICEERGLTLGKLAVVVDMDISRLRQLQRGEARHLGDRLSTGLVAMGYEKGALEQTYATWKQQKKLEVIQECKLKTLK